MLGTKKYFVKVIEPPTINDTYPFAVCTANIPQNISVQGSGYVIWHTTPPALSFDEDYNQTNFVPQPTLEVTNCADFPLRGNKMQICSDLAFKLPQQTFPDPHLAQLKISNPDPGTPHGTANTDYNPPCEIDTNMYVAMLVPPRVDSFTPAFICESDSAQSVDFSGQGFYNIDGQLTTLQFDNQPTPVTGTCTSLGPMKYHNISHCTSLTFSVSTATMSTATTQIRSFAATLSHPLLPPASCGQSPTTAVLPIIPRPRITDVSPNSLCVASNSTVDVVLTGTFVRAPSADPVFTFRGQAMTGTFSGCGSPISVYNQPTVTICTTFTLPFAQNYFTVGDIPITVQQPAPFNCQISHTNIFSAVTPPSITNVVPASVCSGQLDSFIISGGTFFPTTKVTLVPANGGADLVTTPTFINSTTLSLVPPPDRTPAGLYYIKVDSGAGCTVITAATVEVKPIVLIIFVDPPTLYSPVAIEITMLVTGITSGLPRSITAQQNNSVYNLTNFRNISSNTIKVTIPKDYLPPGLYDLSATTFDGCTGVIEKGLLVTGVTTIQIASVEPSYVWTQADSAVTITVASGPVLLPIPRVYLSSISADPSATPVSFATLVTPTQISVVIPQDQTPGDYNVLIVNPDGSVGQARITITPANRPPPVIYDVVPSYFPPNAALPTTIYGDNIEVNATFTSSCIAPHSNETLLNTTLAISTPTYNISSTGPDTITLTISGNNMDGGVVCTIRVTNPSGSSFLYSAVSVKVPSGNPLRGFSMPSITTPRHAFAVASGRATETSRFLYAVGGSTSHGNNNVTRLKSIEWAALDSFGKITGNWQLFPKNDFPFPISYHTLSRVGKFLYVVGGTTNNNNNSLSSVYRAIVLDPLDVPVLRVSVDVTDGNKTTNFTSGLYYYLISTIYKDDDASNPGGESLPSQPLPFLFPSKRSNQLIITISWAPDARAKAYRVYRSPYSGASLDQVELLNETAGLFVNDEGYTTMAGQVPLPVGALGKWKQLANLTLPRSAHSAVVSPMNPSDPTTSYYLYVLGGRSGATFYSSYEYALITPGPNGRTQTVGAWTKADFPAGTNAIAEGGANILYYTQHNKSPRSSYIFFMTALEAPAEISKNPNSDVFYGQIESNGTLLIGKTGASGVPQTGYCFMLAANAFSVTGGGDNVAGVEALTQSNTIRDASPSPASFPFTLPSTFNNGAQYGSGQVRRFHSCILENARVYLIGGNDETATSRTSVFAYVQ